MKPKRTEEGGGQFAYWELDLIKLLRPRHALNDQIQAQLAKDCYRLATDYVQMSLKAFEAEKYRK